MSEPLWASVLEVPQREGCVTLPAGPNHLRELHNTWWGYAAVQLRHSSFHQELMTLHGSVAESRAPAAVAVHSELSLAHQRIDSLQQELQGVKEALRVMLRQTTLRERPELLRG